MTNNAQTIKKYCDQRKLGAQSLYLYDRETVLGGIILDSKKEVIHISLSMQMVM